MIVALERLVDRVRPASAGAVKMHGEFQSVRTSLATAAVVLGCVGMGLMLPSLLKWMRRNRTNGFPVT